MTDHIDLEETEDIFDDDDVIDAINGTDEFYENYMAVVSPGDVEQPKRRAKRVRECHRCNACNHMKLNRVEYCPYCGVGTEGTKMDE